MKNSHLIIYLIVSFFVVGFASSVQAGGVRPVEAGKTRWSPDGKGGAHLENGDPQPHPAEGEVSPIGNAQTAATVLPQYGILYHSGPVMGVGTSSPINVYYIWYGNWTGNTAPAILEPLASHIGGTPYFNINTTYTNSAGSKIVNAVVFKGSTTDSYSRGTTLTDAGVQGVVSSAITSGRLPADANGVYFVLSSKDVNESSGFCTAYCGWHTYGTIAAKTIKYAFVGDAARCPSACTAQSTLSPNGNAGADGMASTIAHELEEAVTDPLLNAWYSKSGAENADLCAWTFGTESVASNRSHYNQTIGGLQYLIQQNWVNVSPSGHCAQSY